jgi:hypothetical protein
MRMHKETTLQSNSNSSHNERHKDEVYRHMFRLEAHRPGAERDLAIALLRAWAAWDAQPHDAKEKTWLRAICPICLALIEAAPHTGESGQPCIQ